MLRSNWLQDIALAAAALVMAAGPVAATSIKVSSNGVNGPTCGSGLNNPPCATIAQAVTNAADGDSILVGAGSYSGATISKPLKLWSKDGNGGAIITSPVTLAADGIVFGKRGKGFSLTPGSASTAIIVTATAVTVRGNAVSNCTIGVDAAGTGTIVRDNSFNGCGTAIRITGSGAQVRSNRIGYIPTYGVLLDTTSSAADVRENRLFGPSGTAIAISGSDHLVRRNFIHGTPGGGFISLGTPTNVQLLDNLVVASSSPGYNLTSGSGWILTRNAAVNNAAPGFYLSAGSAFTLIGNVAIGNSSFGIGVISGGAHILENNTAIDNTGDGILFGTVDAGVSISGGNLYGNSSNCGLNNSSSSAMTADEVYWGAASGPGSDPADAVCGNTAAVVVTNPAVKAVRIKLAPLK